MAYYLYVSISGEDKICIFEMDADTGVLEKQEDMPLEGGPSGLAIAPNKNFLYAVRRRMSKLATLAVDQATGTLAHLGTIEEESDSVYVTVDGAGKFVLTAGQRGARASSYRVGGDGVLAEPAVCTVRTEPGSHSVEVHPSNRFVYVPNCIDSNAIYQYKYDGDTGEITPNTPPKMVPSERLGPRHLRFHPNMAVMYTTDEQGNSISAYHIGESGTVSAFQTISTLPDDFDRSENSTSQLRVHPSGKFLYAPNRGHDSVACFNIDENSGELSLIGRVPTEDHVRGIEVDPQGRFFFAAGAISGKMSAYRIDQDSGELTDRVIYDVGKAPMWVLAVELGG